MALVSAASVGEAALTLIAEQFPGRGTFPVLGAALLAIGIPLALKMRHRPEQHGQVPDGPAASDGDTGEPPEARTITAQGVDFTLGQAMRTRAFWLLAAAMALGQRSEVVVGSYRFLILFQRGIPQEIPRVAADFVPLIGIMLFRYLGDRFSKQHLLPRRLPFRASARPSLWPLA